MFFYFFQSLNEEIVSRKKTVDQAVKNGQALLKQTTGENLFRPVSGFSPAAEDGGGHPVFTHVCLSNVC